MTLAKGIDVAIGLLLVVLIVSLSTSAVTELIARALGKRSKDLWSAIQKLVDGVPVEKCATDRRPGKDAPQAASTAITRALYDSPFINEFRKLDHSGRTLISTVTSTEFARGLIYVAADAATTSENAVAKLRDTLPDSAPAKGALSELVIEGSGKVDDVMKGMGEWYDAQMTRATRAYRRWAKIVALIVGAVIAVSANADLIFVARALNGNDALRSAAVSNATTLVHECSNKTGDKLTQCLQTQTKAITTGSAAIQLPVGWASRANRDFDGWNKLWKAIGWALTAIAAMQGGPFWFDLLRRLVGLRPGTAP